MLHVLLAAPLGPGYHQAQQVRRVRGKVPRPQAGVIAAGIRGCEERTARVVRQHSLGAGKSTPHTHNAMDEQKLVCQHNAHKVQTLLTFL